MNMELNEAKEILNKNGFVLKERFVNVDEIRVPEWLWVAYETGDTSNLEDYCTNQHRPSTFLSIQILTCYRFSGNPKEYS